MSYKSIEAEREYRRNWYQKNINKAKAQSKKSRLKHSEQRKLDTKLWVEYNKEHLKQYRKTHNTGIYGSWYAMKQRCDNPKHKSFHNYGGRGIGYIEAWKSFEEFNRSMSLSYQKGLTLDRIDNNKGYSPENCRWATKKQQANNMRKNTIIEYNGQTLTLTQWAEKLGLKVGTLQWRFRRGWTIEKMMTPELFRKIIN